MVREPASCHEESPRSWVTAALSPGTLWTSGVHQLEYINVPRILMLSEHRGDPSDIRALGLIQSLADASPLLTVMHEFKAAIAKINIHATPLRSIVDFHDGTVGKLISFSEIFRTKNYGKHRDNPSSAPVGDLVRGPQIYLKTFGFRIVMLIDPRWVTTVTAQVDFESGQHRFDGIAMVKNVKCIRRGGHRYRLFFEIGGA